MLDGLFLCRIKNEHVKLGRDIQKFTGSGDKNPKLQKKKRYLMEHPKYREPRTDSAHQGPPKTKDLSELTH